MPDHTSTARKQKPSKTKIAIAGLGLLALCGLAVGGTEAAFNSAASQSLSVSTVSGVDLFLDNARTVDDSAGFAGMNGGESRSVDHTLRNAANGTGHLLGTVHLTGDLSQFAEVDLKVNGQPYVLHDGDQIDYGNLGGQQSIPETISVSIEDTNAAAGQSMTVSIDWLLTAI